MLYRVTNDGNDGRRPTRTTTYDSSRNPYWIFTHNFYVYLYDTKVQMVHKEAVQDNYERIETT
ncbi:MAG: hypothetical protein HOH07_06690 [Euryarchaeota archaeon]|nr:hypothetical protein [Euryarchaeota archaeon]